MVRLSLAAAFFTLLTAKTPVKFRFLAAKRVSLRRHSVGKGYNNDCVLGKRGVAARVVVKSRDQVR